MNGLGRVDQGLFGDTLAVRIKRDVKTIKGRCNTQTVCLFHFLQFLGQLVVIHTVRGANKVGFLGFRLLGRLNSVLKSEVGRVRLAPLFMSATWYTPF